MEKAVTVEDVRTALTGADVFAIREIDKVVQVVCADNPQVARKITELLEASSLTVRQFLLMHPDGKTTLFLNEDGTVTQGNFDKAGNQVTTQIYPAPSLESLTKLGAPAKAG